MPTIPLDQIKGWVFDEYGSISSDHWQTWVHPDSELDFKDEISAAVKGALRDTINIPYMSGSNKTTSLSQPSTGNQVFELAVQVEEKDKETRDYVQSAINVLLQNVSKTIAQRDARIDELSNRIVDLEKKIEFLVAVETNENFGKF